MYVHIYIYTQGLSWVPSYIHSINHHYDIYIYVLVLCIVASVLDPYGLSVCVISPVKYGVYKYIYTYRCSYVVFLSGRKTERLSSNTECQAKARCVYIYKWTVYAWRLHLWVTYVFIYIYACIYRCIYIYGSR